MKGKGFSPGESAGPKGQFYFWIGNAALKGPLFHGGSINLLNNPGLFQLLALCR